MLGLGMELGQKSTLRQEATLDLAEMLCTVMVQSGSVFALRAVAVVRPVMNLREFWIPLDDLAPEDCHQHLSSQPSLPSERLMKGRQEGEM